MNHTPNTPGTAAPYPLWIDRLDAKRYWLFVGLALLYLAGFNGQFHLLTDACLYAEVGRNLATGQGYTFHGQHETLIYPGLPYLHALARTLSPDHHERISQIILLAMAGTMLVLSYQLLRVYAIRPIATLAFLIMATSYGVYEYAFTLMTDMPFTLGTTAALLGYASLFPPTPPTPSDTDQPTSTSRIGRAWVLLASGTALAIVMRPTMLALIIALMLCAACNLFRRTHAKRAIGVLILVTAIVVAFYAIDPRQSPDADLHYEAALADRITSPIDTLIHIVTDNLPRLLTNALPEAVFAVGLDPFTSILLTVLATVFAVVGCWRKWSWILFTVISVGGMLILSAEVPRYFLPMMPFFALGAALTYCHLARRLPPRSVVLIPSLLLALTLAPNVIKTTRFMITQHRTPFYEHYKRGKYMPRLAAAEAIKQYVAPEETVIALSYRMLTYHTHRTVVNINRLDRPKVASVINDRWHHHSQRFYLIEQSDTPPRIDPPGFTITRGPVLAQSPDDETKAPWALRLITLTPTPSDEATHDEN